MEARTPEPIVEMEVSFRETWPSLRELDRGIDLYLSATGKMPERLKMTRPIYCELFSDLETMAQRAMLELQKPKYRDIPIEVVA